MIPLCPVCGGWARLGRNCFEALHHDNCPLNHEPLVALLGALVHGIGKWAAEEDGVPDWLWEKYTEAKALVEVATK